jgi:hypothetical protein
MLDHATLDKIILMNWHCWELLHDPAGTS